MRNYGTAIEATNTALDSAGSAAKENARWTASMEGQLKSLSRAWEDFSRKMINSDMLKKGIKTLTKILEVLSSDVGQAVIKYGLLFASVATGLNLIVKAGMALKGLSLVKFFSGIGKGAKGATDGLKIMQGAQVGATKAATPLYGAFGKLTGSLLGSTGLVAGIGLLSVALAKYVPIGEKARDIKLGKELKEAQDDAEKTEKKYKSLCDELDELHKKEKEGTLTDSEQNRLNILENQTKQYERQVELKKQLAENKADEYYHTVDPTKLEGKAKDKYTLAKSAGKSDKEALAAAGINDKIALSLNNVRARADEVTKAQEKVTWAYEHYGKESKQYKSAIDDLDKAQTKQGDTLTELEKKRKKAIEDYGSVKKANKALGDSWKDLDREIASLKVLKGLNFKKPSKDISDLKKNAKTLGLEFDKSGKKINKIDLTSFSQKMAEAGYSVEDTWTYIQKLSKENPNIKVNIDGTDVAAQDLEFVDGKIQKIEKEKPKAVVTINAKDNASNKMQKIKADKNLGKAQKTLEENGGNKVDATMGKLTKKRNLGKATKNITQNGGDSVQNKLSSISNKKNLGTATKTINFSLSGAIGAAKKFLGLKKGIRHFAGGGTSSIFDNAEVNEQGFEIIQDSDTGLMRVVNGGKRGTTHLNRGDTVYTHGQSVRMLRQAGITEGEAVYGNGNDDFFLSGVRKLKGYASGKTPQEKYNDAYEALTAKYDAGLDTLEYKRDRYRWSDAYFRKQYIKLYNNYRKKLKKLNAKKRSGSVKKRKSLGRDRFQDYSLGIHDVSADASQEAIENYIEGHVLSSTKGLKTALNKIKKSRKNKYITAKEADSYRKDAYKKHLEYNLKQYEDDKKSYSKMSSMLKRYYKKGRITAQEYYDYVAQLREKESEKSKESIESFINDNLLSSTKGITKAINKINKAEKKGYLTTKEATAYRKEAYKKHLEYSLKQYTNDKKSYKATLAMLKNYYKKGRISAQEYYDYLEEVNEHYNDTVRSSIESFINDHLLSSVQGLKNALSKIATAQKNGNITAKEATEYLKEAYKKHLEYNIKQYQDDKKTYAATLAMLQQYHDKKILTDVEYYDYLESLQDHYNDKVKESIETYLSKYRFSTASGLANAIKMINDAEKAGNLIAKEATEYRKDAYTKHLEYNIKQYQNDKKTFKDTLALLKQYYNDKILTDVEYYDYLDSLASTQLGKEKDRLNTQLTTTQNTYDLAKSYVQRQISLLEKENDEQDKQNELVELQNNLAKARNQRVRIYKEGEGFVYEQDTEAIKEATDALKDYQKSNYKNPVLEQWQAILDIFDELETNSQLKRLEQSIGGNATGLFGGLGTDKNAWENWIKNNLSTSGGLQDVISNLDKLVDTNDILNYLDSNGQVTQAITNEAVKQNILPATYASALTQAALTNAGLIGSTIGIGAQSAIASAVGGSVINGSTSQYGNVYNFENLVLPNVTNAQQFLNELSNLSAIALQSSTSRT